MPDLFDSVWEAWLNTNYIIRFTIGFILCFFGYKLKILVIFLIGAAFGAVVWPIILLIIKKGGSIPSEDLVIHVSIAGVFSGLMAVWLDKLIDRLIGALIGLVFGLLITVQSGDVQTIAAFSLGFSVFGAILYPLIDKFLIVIGSAALGSMAMASVIGKKFLGLRLSEAWIISQRSMDEMFSHIFNSAQSVIMICVTLFIVGSVHQLFGLKNIVSRNSKDTPDLDSNNHDIKDSPRQNRQ